MRLLIATPLYPPEPGGPATYAKLLESEFPGEVAVVKFRDVRKYPKGIRHIVYSWRIFRAARSSDMVFALDPVSVGLPSLCAAYLRGKPFAVKVVGDYAWEQGVQRFGISDSLDSFVERKHVPFPVWLLKKVQLLVVTRAHKVIVPSEYLKKIVGAWGIPLNQIHVVYNAIELERGGSVPSALSVPAFPRIVTVSRLVPWKNIDQLIEAVSRLPSDASLVIVGSGPEDFRLKALAAEKLPNRVFFTGPLSHADVLATTESADIFVLNSSYEGFSHVLIEALMLGKPVIATDAGGNTELITSGENGILVPVGDVSCLARTLEGLITDTLMRESLAETAKKRSTLFSTETLVRETSRILNI